MGTGNNTTLSIFITITVTWLYGFIVRSWFQYYADMYSSVCIFSNEHNNGSTYRAADVWQLGRIHLADIPRHHFCDGVKRVFALSGCQSDVEYRLGKRDFQNDVLHLRDNNSTQVHTYNWTQHSSSTVTQLQHNISNITDGFSVFCQAQSVATLYITLRVI